MAEYFVGIGAQKSGTSWLANYLFEHPECAFSPIKEMHVFDCLDDSRLNAQFGNQFAEAILDHAQRLVQGDKQCANNLFLWSFRERILAQPLLYRDYFAHLVQSQHKCFGEITPSYSMLSERGFQMILALYPNAKFIYLMRDPVERFWSAVRFNNQYKGLDSIDGMKRFLQTPSTAVHFERARYQSTLTNLLRVVDLSKTFLCFYEDMFGPNGAEMIAKLTAFLGISYRQPNFNQQVNKAVNADVEIGMKAEIFKYHKEVYENVFQLFPKDTPQAWHDNYQKYNQYLTEAAEL